MADDPRTWHESVLARRYVPGSIALAVCAALYAPCGAVAQTQASTGATAALEEIVVTATRRAENLQDVPISVTAFTQEQMDIQGVRSVDDIARLTPGVQFSRGGGGFGSDLSSSISIRGVSSPAGAATTGVYIDDTPVQVGSTGASGNFADNAYPQLFDVERVEVLKGPQGTLFGSGSEGGTVRFITPSPSFSKASMYVRSEAAYTQYGAPSYEVGIAGGAPLIQDVLGFRASVWTRHDGGYIDRVDWYTAKMVEPNANYTDSFSARLALGWRPADNLTITPSIFFQRIKANESGGIFLHSDGVVTPNPFPPGGNLPVFVNTLGDFNSGNYVNLNMTHQYGDQRLSLPALKIEYAFRTMELLSNTSYYDRAQTGQTDFMSLEIGNWAGSVFPASSSTLTPGFDSQNNHYFTQEVRLQSTNKESPLQWVAGLFYSRNSTNANRSVYDPYLGDLILNGPAMPFCAPEFTAASCERNILGGTPEMGFNVWSFIGNAFIRETQKAVFGQVDYKVTSNLTATLGLRYAKMTNDFQNEEGGPVTGVQFPTYEYGHSDASATTPKYMLSYKTDGGALVYASASKGFRNGGSNAPISNAACTPDLHDLNLTKVPLSFNPDSVWSYELGTKFRTDQGRLQVDASVFQINWNNQQRNVFLAHCTLSFTTNLGTAQSRGMDLQVQYRPVDPLLLGLNAGYQSVKATEDLVGSLHGGPDNGILYLARNGQSLPGSQPTVNVSGQYSFNALGYPSYLRADFTYIGQSAGISSTSASLLNNVAGYSEAAAEFRDPSYRLTNLRLGMNIGNWDVSVFANNVFNEQPMLGLTRGTVTFFAVPSAELTTTTLRPRTVGVTGVLRF